MSRLYNLLEYYKRRDLDNLFIEQAFEILLEEHEDLLPYIRDFKIVDHKSLGAYLLEDKKIEICPKSIVNDHTNINGYENPKILALEVLVHEMEHARQLKMLYEGREDIESLIAKYSLKEYAIHHNMIGAPKEDEFEKITKMIQRRMSYAYDPGERLCEIKGWRSMVNLLKNQRTSEDLLLARGMLFNSYLRGYDDNRYYLEPPTYTYLMNMGYYIDLKRLKGRVAAKDYCFKTRITYGLPITYQEYKKNVSELTKVKIKGKRRN